MWGIALAVGGQVMVESVTLDEVVQRTDVAVIVELGSPAMGKVSIPVSGAPEKRCDPYEYGTWEVTVAEVVLPPRAGPSLPVGERLTIWPSNTGMLIDLTRQACLHGTRKSPIVQRFDGIPAPDGGRALVLLRWEPPWGWVEAVGGSWLAPKDAPKLARTERPPGAAAPDGAVELACRSDADCVSTVLGCGVCPPCPSTPHQVVHRVAARWEQERCAASRSPGAGTPGGPVAPVAPACSPCPGDPPSRPLPVACRELRCVEAR